MPTQQKNVLLFLTGIFFSLTTIVHAQQDIAFNSPKESVAFSYDIPSEWIFLCKTGDMIYSYNTKSLIRTDSANLRVEIRETPNPLFYIQLKSDKLREHRILEDYSDRLHLKYEYGGYENYAYTVREKEIDRKEKKCRIMKTMDYDTYGVVLETKEAEPPVWESTVGMAAESLIIDSLFKTTVNYYTGPGR